jgi:hypothetical protein
VPQAGVQTDVRQFITAEITSVGQLEVLLLLRDATEKRWTVDEVARALVMQRSAAASWLEQMAASALIGRVGAAYGYDPPTVKVERTIDRLAESYAKYRVAVIALIFSKPSDAVTEFPEAFRIRKRED